MEVYAGEKANEKTGEWLPEETFEALREFKVGIKGPLTTPVGGGIRSLNVTLRQVLDLYSCIRPVRWIEGVPAPVKEPERLDVVIYRENTEDVYAGIEWASGSAEARRVRAFLVDEMGSFIREESGIGIKPISPFGTKRHMASAIRYALDRNSRVVTLVHKGNIMKFTEGAFKDWGYEVAQEEFADVTIAESAVWDGADPAGKLLINDRIADAMFQQVLLRPDEYDIIVTPESQRRLSLRCVRRTGRWSRHGAGSQRRRRGGALRGDSRNGPQVHQLGQSEPRFADPLSRDDA